MNSSTIKAIQYDEKTRTMDVTFKSGGTYRYHGVDPEHHDAFRKAESLGSHLHKHIKPNHRAEKLK